MRRLALTVAAVAVIAAATALAVAVASSRESAATTSLTVTFWASGGSGKGVKWTLRCNPAGGTLRRPARACPKLKAGGPKLFAPLPRDLVCTEIYGGPQTARVRGKVGGKPVDASFSRSNGCQIDRWDKLSPWLLPRGGVT